MTNKTNNIQVQSFFAVIDAEIELWDAFEKALQEAGLPMSVGRFIPLHHLTSGPLRLQELTELSHAKQSAMSRMVERMMKDGLVEKRRDDDDGRAVSLCITDEGRSIERRARAVFEACLSDMFAPLTDDDMSTLIMLLGRIKVPGEKVRA